MLRTTAGQLAVNHALPESLQDHARVLDKKSIEKLLQTAAERHPEKYRDIVQHLATVGRQSAQQTGGFSAGLADMRLSAAGRMAQRAMRQKIDAIYETTIPDQQKEQKVIELLSQHGDTLSQNVLKESLAEHNAFAMQLIGAGRGNASNLRSLRGFDGLYVDHHDRPIPIPVLRSYSQGLNPAEYFAGTFGARKGVISTKFAVQKAGFASKQFNQIAHRLVVTGLDREGDDDQLNPRGLPVAADDPDNEGALLAQDHGTFKRNTVLTPKILSQLQQAGHQRLLVRSPLVGGSIEGGVYARDLGIREKGILPPTGDQVGVAAAQSLCLAEGTQVRMADGSVKPIEAVEPGDLVLGSSVAGVVRPVRVIRRYDNGYKLVHETTFRLGTGKSQAVNLLKLRSTLDHKILAVTVADKSKNRRPAAAIQPVRRPQKLHDRFYAKLTSSYDDTGHVSEPFALALGLLIGDGCYTGGVTSFGVNFSCHDPVLANDVKDYFYQLGCQLVPQSTYGEYRVSTLTKGKRLANHPTTGVRNPVRAKLLTYAMWGQRSHEKQLPVTTAWDNASVAALLAGLFATDGCVHVCKNGRVNVGFGSTSKQLTEGIRWLLMSRFGIYPSAPCSNEKKKRGGGAYRPMYNIAITGHDNLNRFTSAIAIPGVKGPLLTAALAVWLRSIKSSEAGRCSLVSQQEIGVCKTYDIEVDHPDHLFVLANGLIVSNSEPLTQGMLGAKHAGGVAGASKVGGFELINSLVQVPKIMKGGAAHAQVDGRVHDIREAPQGGTYVTVDNQQHYVGHGFKVTVKPGDQVEAGDVLSDGVPNPAEVVKHKGIGEGRRYFTEAFRDAYRDSNLTAHRRNIELLARGLINHVELDDEVGPHVPGDVVPYHQLEQQWEPRPGHKLTTPQAALSKYLEQPVLHYSVGTKVKPSVVQNLQDFKIPAVMTHHEPPPFKPVMIRGMENLAHDEDWLTRFLGSHLKKNFLRGVHRGHVSDEHSTSYVPSLARSIDFGKDSPLKGYTPTGPAPIAPKPAASILQQMQEAHKSASAYTVEPLFRPRLAPGSNRMHLPLADPFKAFQLRHPAGTHRELADEDSSYPLAAIRYPVDHGSLPGYKGEDAQDLDVLKGTDPRGESGYFYVHRPESSLRKTKFFHQVSAHEKDQMLRAFAPILASAPRTVPATELAAELEKYHQREG